MLIITATLKKEWAGRAIFALSSNPTEYCFIDSYYAFNAIKASIGAHKHIYSAFIKCHIISYYRRERSLYAFMHLNGTQTFVVYLKIGENLLLANLDIDVKLKSKLIFSKLFIIRSLYIYICIASVYVSMSNSASRLYIFYNKIRLTCWTVKTFAYTQLWQATQFRIGTADVYGRTESQ